MARRASASVVSATVSVVWFDVFPVVSVPLSTSLRSPQDARFPASITITSAAASRLFLRFFSIFPFFLSAVFPASYVVYL